MTTPTAAVSQAPPAQPGEALTRRAVTAVTIAIVLMTFAFSLGNVTRLCVNLGITAWIAWLVAPGRPERRRAADRDALPVPARLYTRRPR